LIIKIYNQLKLLIVFFDYTKIYKLYKLFIMEIPHSITEIENYITKFLPGGIIINKNPNINN